MSRQPLIRYTYGTVGIALLLGAGFLIGFNGLYVLAINSHLAAGWKQLAGFALVLFKTVVFLVIIPKVVRVTAERYHAEQRAQFGLQVAFATLLGVLNLVVLPVIAVLLADSRCLYDAYHALPSTTTTVGRNS